MKWRKINSKNIKKRKKGIEKNLINDTQKLKSE